MKKLHASGEDYLEAVLVLQKKKAWCALWMWPGIWEFPSPVCAMRCLP